MKLDTTQTLTFLGWENDWKETPEQVKKCREQGHKIKTESTINCEHTYTCEECGIYWKMDSGD